MHQNILFEGCATALVTPFRDGKVDFAALARLIEYQLEGGVTTLVLCGTTGESATLSPAEKQAIFSFACAEYASRATLIAGCGSPDTATTVRLCQMAAASGVNGILSVTPYYNKPTENGLFSHYEAITAATDLPVIAYTVPSRTGVGISPSLWQRLCTLPNIWGIKDAGQSQNVSVCYCLQGEKAVYSGNDDSILPLLALGGRGCISVISNLMPAQVQALCDTFREGDLAEARRLQGQMLPLVQALFAETNPIPVKWALARLGFCRSDLRLPLCPPCDKTIALLEKEMEALGLL